MDTNTTSEAVLTLALTLFLARETGRISDRKMDREFRGFLKHVGWTPENFAASGTMDRYLAAVAAIRAAA
jgi:hypothetical protein